jgi:hypothetical protein
MVTVTWLDTEPSPMDIYIPWVNVHTWKFQFLADEQSAFPPS